MRPRWLVLLAIPGLCAAGPPPDPDWPCVQRPVPTLTAGQLWAGPPADADWHDDPAVAALVAELSPRGVSAQAASARLDPLMTALPAKNRPATSARLFAGLVDETNVQRTEVMERLRSIARRQRLLTDLTGTATAELRALPPTAAADQREEIVSRRALLIREYEQIERTIRYACEIPVQMEAKLGAIAQKLQSGLSN